ncbi:MAG: hypothetical protein RMK18_00115 [Armatimonadota bacterium]|nr:hypothetical protein [Armatimonadota bacterium]MCX7776462.1 hypothetical protein [Armatimonadota bacterium]MDW8024260.1 hypothetical protein [Armatimonadota bacterium]
MVVRRFRPTEIIACIFILGFIAAVLVSSFFAYRYEQSMMSAQRKPIQQTTKPTELVPQIQTGMPNTYIAGAKDAKVRIEAFLPFDVECHMINIALLIEVLKAEGKRIHLELYNMHSPEGSKAMEKRNVHCATILANGEVISSGPQADVVGLITKIDELLKKAYGSGMNTKAVEQLKQKWAKATMQEAANFVRQVFADRATKGEELKGIPVAKPSEKVEVVFYMPPKDTPGVTNFPEAIERVERLRKQHGERLSVKIIDMMSEEAMKARMEGLIQGPCVLVNGSYRHLVKVGSQTKVVRLDAEPLAHRFIDPESVETVVKAYLGIPIETMR